MTLGLETLCILYIPFTQWTCMYCMCSKICCTFLLTEETTTIHSVSSKAPTKATEQGMSYRMTVCCYGYMTVNYIVQFTL